MKRLSVLTAGQREFWTILLPYKFHQCTHAHYLDKTARLAGNQLGAGTTRCRLAGGWRLEAGGWRLADG